MPTLLPLAWWDVIGVDPVELRTFSSGCNRFSATWCSIFFWSTSQITQLNKKSTIVNKLDGKVHLLNPSTYFYPLCHRFCLSACVCVLSVTFGCFPAFCPRRVFVLRLPWLFWGEVTQSAPTGTEHEHLSAQTLQIKQLARFSWKACTAGRFKFNSVCQYPRISRDWELEGMQWRVNLQKRNLLSIFTRSFFSWGKIYL